jgi:hypothetical protein
MKCKRNLPAFLTRAIVPGIGLLSFHLLIAGSALAASHADLTTYEGSKTCNECHFDKAKEVHGSAHYQWKGRTPEVPDLAIAGKLGQTNDFCTYPNINWLFKVQNVEGQLQDAGCASCHVGLGAKPTRDATQTQLENIDCLICHSDLYKRKIEVVNGVTRFVPDPTVDIQQVFAGIQMPSKATCLKCHAKAGGGDGLKQGDMSLSLADPPNTLDVHMSANGVGLGCLDCHTAEKHRIAGRGNDLRETDRLNAEVSCANCHGIAPHGEHDIDKHTNRVDCVVCHVPEYGRALPTETLRDHSQAQIDPLKKLYEPARTLASNIVPKYKFWNRMSSFYKFGDPISVGKDGHVLLAGPLGNITDPDAKIYAFKHHQANLAHDPVTMRLLPVKSRVYWQTGNVQEAFTVGANQVGWTLENGVDFLISDRYLSLHHTVAPAENALACGACHGGDRIDFAALGYTPKTQREGGPLCASCHKLKNADFTKLHKVHVDDKSISCGLCHNF